MFEKGDLLTKPYNKIFPIYIRTSDNTFMMLVKKNTWASSKLNMNIHHIHAL